MWLLNDRNDRSKRRRRIVDIIDSVELHTRFDCSITEQECRFVSIKSFKQTVCGRLEFQRLRRTAAHLVIARELSF